MKTSIVPGFSAPSRSCFMSYPSPLFFRVMSWVVALTGTGCGASMDAMYEGNIRFEHCMALDAQPQVATGRRHACWRDWLDHYTYGQTKDRVDHAQSRVGTPGSP